ncbi:MAG: CvpA family protein [Thermomicrobiales bacterium]
MNPLDIAILIFVGLIGVKGLRRGFIRGVADLAGWLVAMVAASRFAPALVTWLTGTAVSPVAPTAAFSITFMVALAATGFAVDLALKSLGFLPRIPPFSFLNSVLGIAPGVVKGAMLASIILAPLLAFDGLLGESSPVTGSILARPVVDAVDRLTNGAYSRAGVDPPNAGLPVSTP